MNTINIIRSPYGNNIHIASHGTNGGNNTSQIVQIIFKLFKTTSHQHFILKFNQYLDDLYNNYNIIPVTKEQWPYEYNNENSVGYINIIFGNDNKYFIFGRIKSTNSYWTINKVIYNNKIIGV